MRKISWNTVSQTDRELIYKWDQEYLDPAWSVQQWEQSRGEDYHLAGIYCDHDLAGFLLFYFPARMEVAHLLKFAIHRPQRGMGLSFWSLGQSEQYFLSKGALRLYLEVAADNAPAIAVYQQWGMQPLHRQRHFYGRGRDALTMQKECKKSPLSD